MTTATAVAEEASSRLPASLILAQPVSATSNMAAIAAAVMRVNTGAQFMQQRLVAYALGSVTPTWPWYLPPRSL